MTEPNDFRRLDGARRPAARPRGARHRRRPRPGPRRGARLRGPRRHRGAAGPQARGAHRDLRRHRRGRRQGARGDPPRPRHRRRPRVRDAGRDAAPRPRAPRRARALRRALHAAGAAARPAPRAVDDAPAREPRRALRPHRAPACRCWQAAPDGAVVFTAETHAFQPAAYWGAFAVSKSGLGTLAAIWADECEQAGKPRFHVVVPGPVATPQRAQSHPGENRGGAAHARNRRRRLPEAPRARKAKRSGARRSTIVT